MTKGITNMSINHQLKVSLGGDILDILYIFKSLVDTR